MRYKIIRNKEKNFPKYSIIVYSGIQLNEYKVFYISDISHTIIVYDFTSEFTENCLNLLIKNNILIFNKIEEITSRFSTRKNYIKIFNLTQSALLEML